MEWTIFLTDADDVPAGFAAFTEFWDTSHPAPAITVQIVVGLANPAFLVEIEAVAAIQT